MSQNKSFDLLATGMAIFAMFFGAGNIIFPLALGQQATDQSGYAILGLLCSAIFVPFCGLIAMFLYRGDVTTFFGRLGYLPGMALAFFIIALLGPIGSTPRCIALSYSTISQFYPTLAPSLFHAIACLFIFVIAFKKNHILPIIGYLLTPFLLALLAIIIMKGLWDHPQCIVSLKQMNPLHTFWQGLREGYKMMDLLAAFFFAPVIIRVTKNDATNSLFFVLKASAIGAILLALLYIGFVLLASVHSADLNGVPSEQLIAAISLKILGPYGGIVVCMTVVLACFTTAIALIAAFAEFVYKELLKEKINYPFILAISLCATYLVASLEFQGISTFLNPILEICYPFLIILTGVNLIDRLSTKPFHTETGKQH